MQGAGEEEGDEGRGGEVEREGEDERDAEADEGGGEGDGGGGEEEVGEAEAEGGLAADEDGEPEGGHEPVGAGPSEAVERPLEGEAGGLGGKAFVRRNGKTAEVPVFSFGPSAVPIFEVVFHDEQRTETVEGEEPDGGYAVFLADRDAVGEAASDRQTRTSDEPEGGGRAGEAEGDARDGDGHGALGVGCGQKARWNGEWLYAAGGRSVGEEEGSRLGETAATAAGMRYECS